MKILSSKLGLLAATGLMAAMFVTTASAQQPNLMRVQIPFAFLAGDRTMPAGDYMVKFEPNFNLVDLVPMQGTTTLRVLMKMGFVRRPKDAGQLGLLTFAKYGDRLVLRGVWASGDREGPRSKDVQGGNRAGPHGRHSGSRGYRNDSVDRSQASDFNSSSNRGCARIESRFPSFSYHAFCFRPPAAALERHSRAASPIPSMAKMQPTL